MRKTNILIAAVWLLSPRVAAADSDGYYCVGPGYVAYETRLAEGPARHALHVVRFSRAQGLVPLAPIPLEDFQVHAMRCGSTVVELQAWSTAYAVDIADPTKPTVTHRSAAFGPGQPAAKNLGFWADEGVVNLESDAPGEFQLVIARVSRAAAGGVEHYTFSQVIRREPRAGGRILASLTLFQGIFLETAN